MSGFLHSLPCLWNFSMFLLVAIVHFSFIMLSHPIAWIRYNLFCILQLTDIWVVSSSLFLNQLRLEIFLGICPVCLKIQILIKYSTIFFVCNHITPVDYAFIFIYNAICPLFFFLDQLCQRLVNFNGRSTDTKNSGMGVASSCCPSTRAESQVLEKLRLLLSAFPK